MTQGSHWNRYNVTSLAALHLLEEIKSNLLNVTKKPEFLLCWWQSFEIALYTFLLVFPLRDLVPFSNLYDLFF